MSGTKQRDWDEDLHKALQEGVLTGYALILHDGQCECAYGVTRDELLNERGQLSPTAQRLLKVMAADIPMEDSLSVAAFNRKLIVFKRTDWQVYALSNHRRVGLCMHRLRFGTLITTFNHRVLPNVVVAQVEKVAFQLMRI